MDDLVTFLGARLDEDEQFANAGMDALGAADGNPGWPDYQTFSSPALDTAQDYLDRFQPARILREVEAKRLIIGLHRRESELDYDPICNVCCYTPPCETLLALAVSYSDHADYREEWKL